MARISGSAVKVTLAVCLIGVSLTPVFAATYFPSQNGPWYLLAGHMLTHLSDPAYDYSFHYTTNLHAIPHVLHTLAVAVFCLAVPALWAQKLAISLYVIGLPVSIFYFLGAVTPNRRWLGFFSFLMIHTYCFYRGYHNFSLSVPLYFLTLGQWLRSLKRPSSGRYVATILLVSLTYLSHLFTFGILAASMGWYLLCMTRRFWHSTAAAIAYTWPGWLMMIEFIWLNSQINTWVDTDQRVWLAPPTAVEYFFRKFFYTTSFPAYVIGAAAAAGLIALFLAAVWSAQRSERPWWEALLSRPWLSLTLILTGCYFVLPWKFLNWHHVSVRIIPFVLGSMLAAVARSEVVAHRQTLRRVFVGTCAACTLVICGLMVQEVRAMNVLLDQYTAGIPHLPPNSRVLPINLENPRHGQIRPLTRAYEYYHIARGGVNGSGAAVYNTLVPVRYLTYPDEKTLPRYHPKIHSGELESLAYHYDAVLIWGGDSRLDVELANLGFSPTFRQGSLRLFVHPRTSHSGDAFTAMPRNTSHELPSGDKVATLQLRLPKEDIRRSRPTLFARPPEKLVEESHSPYQQGISAAE